MPVEPRKAATVILLRDKTGEGVEVFLLRRHEKNAFMGGNFVYPGGRVDRGDWDPAFFPRDDSLMPPREWTATSRPREENIACRVSAIRELFEEAGILLARQNGEPVRMEGEFGVRFTEYRALFHSDQLEFGAIISRETLQLGLHDLCYYAHWITPEARSMRFDTHFFLARHPSHQEATCDRKETTEGIWITPGEALDRNLKGEVPLSPPALKTLENLSRFSRIDDILASLSADPVRPVLPILTSAHNQTFLIFPWDPEYEAYRIGQQGKADHGRPSGPMDSTTRLIMAADRWERWIPYCKEQ